MSIIHKSLAVENKIVPFSLNSISRHALRCNSKVDINSTFVLLYLYLSYKKIHIFIKLFNIIYDILIINKYKIYKCTSPPISAIAIIFKLGWKHISTT